MAGRFNLEKLKKGSTIDVGMQHMNSASLALATGQKKTEYIELDLIDPNPDNNLSLGKVPWLKQDILLNGLLQPLIVEQLPDGRYKLYAGHQRFEALTQLRSEGKWGSLVEVKVIDIEKLRLPEKLDRKIKEKMVLRSANIQRGSGYATDADRFVVIQDWKEIYAALRKCGVEVIEFGLESDGVESEQIKGVKTQDLVAERLGMSHAQVAKYDKVSNKGSEAIIDALKENKISVAVASQLVDRPKEEQDVLIQKALESSKGESVSKEDLMVAEHEISKEKIEPTAEEIKSFYEVIKKYDIKRSELKEYLVSHFGKTHSTVHGGDLEYQCSIRGIKLGKADEITWNQYIKLLNDLVPVSDSENKETYNTEEQSGHLITAKTLKNDLKEITKKINQEGTIVLDDEKYKSYCKHVQMLKQLFINK